MEYVFPYLTLPVSFVIIVVVFVFWWMKKYHSPSSLPRMHYGSSILQQHSENLTERAQNNKLEPVVGREKEIEKVIQVLSRKTKNNPVLVGKAGVGKTAIAEGFAQAIVTEKVPESLKGKQVLALDLTSIIAGTKFRGEFEKRLLAIRDEIIASNRDIILFIDEIHTLAEAGDATGAMDADDILKPALARGELQVIGATTSSEYDEYIAKDVTLARRFQLINVAEPTKKQTLQILQGIKKKYEEFHGVTIQDTTLSKAINLSEKKYPKRSFPDKAIDLIDEACAKVQLQKVSDKKASSIVTPHHVELVANE